jgi:hypothetical protein
MSARDRKILLLLVPVVVLGAFWFLVLGPKRQEATQAGEELAKQEQRLADAEQSIQPLESAKASFASDYTQLVRLGKAVPTKVDMPTVIVQLEQAAKGTGITFNRIATGERIPATAAPAAPGAPATPGGQPAASGPGQAAQTAGNQVDNANQQSANAEQQSGAQPGDTQTSTNDGASAPATGAGAAPGLDRVTLELEFEGSFFRLADFFHDLKRFVRAANNRIEVRGRLLTVESLNFLSDPAIFPRLRAELGATIYLAPQAQGTTAGATPQGPAPASAPTGGASPASPNPTATATP